MRLVRSASANNNSASWLRPNFCSTQLRRIVWETAHDSMTSGQSDPLVPVYVDLKQFNASRAAPGDMIQYLILNGLQPYWPNVDAEDLKTTSLRCCFDNSDFLRR